MDDDDGLLVEPEDRQTGGDGSPTAADAPDTRGCWKKCTDFVAGQIAAIWHLPMRWKFVWLAGVVLWSPLAFTVLLVVPGSMTLFFAVWTPFVIRLALKREEARKREEEEALTREDEGGTEAGSGEVLHARKATSVYEDEYDEGDSEDDAPLMVLDPYTMTPPLPPELHLVA